MWAWARALKTAVTYVAISKSMFLIAQSYLFSDQSKSIIKMPHRHRSNYDLIINRESQVSMWHMPKQCELTLRPLILFLVLYQTNYDDKPLVL